MIELLGVSAGYGSGPLVIQDLNLSIQGGLVYAVVGPTGCGKTSLLKLLAGLLKPRSGRVVFDNPSDARRVALIPQDYGLFPWKTVRDNAIMGLQIQRRGGAEDLGRVDALLKELGIAALSSRWPATLSGGQKQRVAIARALAVKPALLLMDEPFSALDAAMREDLQCLVRSAQTAHGATPVLVTHDIGEALRVADRVVLFARDLESSAPHFSVEVLENDGSGGSTERRLHDALRFALKAAFDGELLDARS